MSELRRRLMMQQVGGGGVGLPSEYQQVEWIRSDGLTFPGAPYINTNLIDNTNNYIIEADVTMDKLTVGTYPTICGAGFRSFWLYVRTYSPTKKIGCGQWKSQYLGGDTGSPDFDILPYTRYNIRVTSTPNSLQLDIGDRSLTGTYTNSFSGATINILGNPGSTSRQDGPFNEHLHSIKITQDGIISGEFYPCYRKSDNVIGMYDIARHKFFTNAGSGSFIVGPDVN